MACCIIIRGSRQTIDVDTFQRLTHAVVVRLDYFQFDIMCNCFHKTSWSPLSTQQRLNTCNKLNSIWNDVLLSRVQPTQVRVGNESCCCRLSVERQLLYAYVITIKGNTMLYLSYTCVPDLLVGTTTNARELR